MSVCGVCGKPWGAPRCLEPKTMTIDLRDPKAVRKAIKYLTAYTEPEAR